MSDLGEKYLSLQFTPITNDDIANIYTHNTSRSGLGTMHKLCATNLDSVLFARTETGDHFHLEVAAYTEFQPQTNSALTQYFGNADNYFHFVDA
jgi:hypothetical protein